MTNPLDRDPIDDLRRANPVDVDRLPHASLARVRARFQEAVNVEEQETSRRERNRWRLPNWAAGIAATGLAVIVAAIVVGRGAGSTPTHSPTTGPVSAMCVEQYSLDTLKHRGFAFDGTVTSMSGDEVTFSVGERFLGSLGASVTLTAAGMTGTSITSAGGPNLAVGDRYLVAGDDHFVWACGFTQPYDASVAAQWKQSTGS